MIKPTPENLKAYEAWICDAKQDSTFFPDTIGGPTECARVEINAGQTFFLPSGWLHAVLTPVDSLVFGGNFLPGLATVDLQLAVRDIEKRTHVNNCVEIKSSRRVRAESSRRPPRHRRDTCSMGWR